MKTSGLLFGDCNMRFLELFPNSECSENTKKQVYDLLEQEWPEVIQEERKIWPTEPLSWNPITIILFNEHKNIVGLVIVQSAYCQVDLNIYKVSGIGSMVINKNYRNRGYGRILFKRADQIIKKNKNDFGVFTCDDSLVSFYSIYGWNAYKKAVLIGGTKEDPFNSKEIGKATILKPFSSYAEKNWESISSSEIFIELGYKKLW
jgi:GNAT superfamily N-acetyltransferase